MIANIDIIVPTFKSKDITLLSLKSFLKFNDYFNFKYFVVENSDDESYKNDVMSLSDDVVWIQNPISEVGSFANAIGIQKGLEYSKSDYVFFCHNDVMAVHKDWMGFIFEKITKEDYCVSGFTRDPNPGRINAVHISGVLTKSEIARSVDLYPVGNGSYMDVGDSLTKYCMDNGLKHFSCNNVYDGTFPEHELKFPFNELHHVDRAVSDNGEVLYLHIGRGTPKTHNTYHKLNRMTVEEWVDFGTDLLQ